MRHFFLAICSLYLIFPSIAQRYKVDSLQQLLVKEKQDSNKVTLMWNISLVSYAYQPDSALIYGDRALSLARKIKFTEGESRALGIMANSFLKIGNYPRALELYLDKLKIEEKRNNPRNLASVIMNIGIVYVYQEEFRRALPYYYKADSLIRVNNVEDLKYNIAVNLGDVYYKLGTNDSAFFYFRKSLEIARAIQNGNLVGSSLVGMGHSYSREGNYVLAIRYYREGIDYLFAANDEDLVCEAALGLARVYQSIGIADSAEHYARYTHNLAEKDGFLSWQFEATRFLTDHFSKKGWSDSAFKYVQVAQVFKDSLNSKERIRESQVLSINEQLRQVKMAEEARKSAAERSQQLQLLFIGIFIPGLFLFTVFLSRRRVNVKVIRTMGIISLLILFEYLTLLLHPRVLALANYTPVIEIMIFVGIAAILIPTHHRVEHWLIGALTRNRFSPSSGHFNLQTKKLKTKKPSGSNITGRKA